MTLEDLIIRSLQGRTTSENEVRLRRWRESAPENDGQYRQIAELWALLAVAEPDRVLPPGAGEIERLIARAEESALGAADVPRRSIRTGARPNQKKGQPAWARPLVTGLLAASLAAVGFGLGAFSGRAGDPVLVQSVSEVVTGDGEQATVTLSDGTGVRMGPNSTIRVLEGGGDPVIWLEGRAFFGVVPDSTRAFTVRTEYGDAIALGTRFEVRTDEQEFRVLVIEGNVRVATASATLEIGRGLMSRSAHGVPPSTSAVGEVHQQLEWIGATLMFRATPLSQVISEIEHQYDVVVTLENEDLREETVTATFTNQPADDVLFVVCQTVRAGCAVDNGHFRIGDPSLGMLGRPITSPR